MKKLLSVPLSIGLLIGVSACASDSAPAAAPVPSFQIADGETLTSLQQRVADITYAAAIGGNQPIAADCLKAVVSHLSEADAALIVNNTAPQTPTLSPAGSTLAAAVKACLIIEPASTTTVTSATAG